MAGVSAALSVPVWNIGHVPSDAFPPSGNGSSRINISKPSWIVKTESNVRRERYKKPDPPCVVCSGSGRTDCHYCQGRGRTNCVHLAMLPKGEWPRWCKVCGGSGLGYCDRCLGTGEYRDIMGFHFMKMDPRFLVQVHHNTLNKMVLTVDIHLGQVLCCRIQMYNFVIKCTLKLDVKFQLFTNLTFLVKFSSIF